MTEFFLNVVNMSISASWLVCAVLLLRLLLKKAPKWINVLLWGIVAVRLICPFSFESVLSLIPSSQTINPEIALNAPVIDSGVTIIDNVINPIIGEATISLQPEKDVNLFQFIMPYLAGVWLVGIAALLIYTLISFLRLKRKIGTAVLLRDNIYQSEAVVSPFVLGVIKPKIYLPFNMNGQDMNHVIAHERAHIRRKDHFWKPLGFLILTLHWFNPVVWFGYILLCRDIELACDEKVVKELNNEQRAYYSEALLACSVNRRMIAACPLAFGEVGVKDRIKSVLNYKKPAFWIIVVAIVVSITVAVCFLTNPVNTSIYNSSYETGKCLYSYVVSADKETKSNELFFDITSDGKVYKIFGDGTTDELGVLKESDYTAEELEAAIKNQDAKLNIGNIKNAYELSDCIFLQKSNGTVYLVQFFSDGRIMSVFKLNRIDKSDISNFSGSEKLAWNYNPSLSHTAHYTRAFAFDCEYTYVDATCTGGEFWNLEAEGQPRGTNIRFEKEKKIYWTPAEDDENPIDKSEVTLTVYNGDTKMQQHTVIFECVSRDYSTGDIYEFYLKDAMEFALVYSEYGYLTFVERSSISNEDVSNNSQSVTKTKSIKRIVDHSVDDGVSYDNAFELFYTDDKYNYYFSNIISQYIIVEFDNGTKNNVKDALTAGEITISDLDKFEIQYSKTEKSVQPGANPYFNAEVLEVTEKNILVKPDDSKETKSADKIYVSLDVISEIPVPTINTGDRVRVIYNGEIAETYPAQINNVFVIYLLGENDMVLSPTPLQ